MFFVATVQELRSEDTPTDKKKIVLYVLQLDLIINYKNFYQGTKHNAFIFTGQCGTIIVTNSYNLIITE